MNSTITAQPTLLVVDDKIEDASDYIDLFREQGGFRVVTARGRQEAKARARSEPGIEAVSTDISLESEGIDIEGAHLAQDLAEMLPGLPIAGYSGFRGLSALPQEVQPAFRHWIERGDSADSLISLVHEMRDEALDYRAVRTARSESLLDQITITGLSESAFQEVGSETRKLKANDFELRAVMPVFAIDAALRGKRPIVCWVRGSRRRYEGEVVGQPTLYAAGVSISDVLQKLVELVEVFAEELEIRKSPTLRLPRRGPAAELTLYLDSVLERRDATQQA